MAETVSFRQVSDSLQDAMRKDTETIKNSKDTIVKADKTRNLYQVPKEQFSKLMKENITKNYKIAPENAYDEVNSEAKEIAQGLDLQNRMDVLFN